MYKSNKYAVQTANLPLPLLLPKPVDSYTALTYDKWGDFNL